MPSKVPAPGKFVIFALMLFAVILRIVRAHGGLIGMEKQTRDEHRHAGMRLKATGYQAQTTAGNFQST